jgi:hypothetical protein
MATALGFKSGKPDAQPDRRTMRKGVTDLHRCAEVSHAANGRYLQALAVVQDYMTTNLPAPAGRFVVA